MIEKPCSLISFWISSTLLFSSSACALQPSTNSNAAIDNSTITRAFETKSSNIQVEGEGTIDRLLADDLDGGRHQRFIVRLPSGQTILIAHNIDLAARIADLKKGDTVSFYGEYVWNAQGGTVHWTHHDPQGRHLSGWLKHNGQTYQ